MTIFLRGDGISSKYSESLALLRKDLLVIEPWETQLLEGYLWPLSSSEVQTGKQSLKVHKRGEQETLCQADIKGHCTGRIKAPLAGPRGTWRAICHPLQLSGRNFLSMDLHGHIQGRTAEGALLRDSTAFVTYLLLGQF